MLHASGARCYMSSIPARGKSCSAQKNAISKSSVQNKGKEMTPCLLCQKSNGWVLGEGATMETRRPNGSTRKDSTTEVGSTV